MHDSVLCRCTLGWFQVVGRITAGVDPDSIQVSPGKCAYITTGAKLPQGADAVVKVRRTNGRAHGPTDERTH